MLTRLLTNLDQIEACLLSGEGEIVGGEGEGNITLFHRAMKMATTLNMGRIDEMWFVEGKNDFRHHPNFCLRALRELHIGFTLK